MFRKKLVMCLSSAFIVFDSEVGESYWDGFCGGFDLFHFLQTNVLVFYVYFHLGLFLTVVGFLGLLLSARNLLLGLLCLEISVLGMSFLFLLYTMSTYSLFGFLCAFLILLLTGAESALGLALIMLLHRINYGITFKTLANLRT